MIWLRQFEKWGKKIKIKIYLDSGRSSEHFKPVIYITFEASDHISHLYRGKKWSSWTFITLKLHLLYINIDTE